MVLQGLFKEEIKMHKLKKKLEEDRLADIELDKRIRRISNR